MVEVRYPRCRCRHQIRENPGRLTGVSLSPCPKLCALSNIPEVINHSPVLVPQAVFTSEPMEQYVLGQFSCDDLHLHVTAPSPASSVF
jgi:hypothetical protein